MMSHVDLSAGTSGALGRYKTATAVPRVSRTEIDTGNPSQRILYLISANK